MRDAFIFVEAGFVCGEEGVDEAVDGVGVGWGIGGLRGGEFDHVGVASIVDNPFVVV